MRRRIGVLVAAVAALVGVVLPAGTAAAQAAAADCAVTWGSATKSAAPTAGGDLVGLRAGGHDCYDRLVFDVSGAAAGTGYWASYVDEVTEDPTGEPVPLRGGARLAITVHAPSYDESGAPTYTYADPAELVDVTGYQTFRQVAWAGSWEGTTTVGLGVRAQLPFRVFTLPGRVVVDVAHQW